MKNPQRGFIVPLLLAIIAVLLVGGGMYVFTQNKQENPPVTENVTLPQATSTVPTTNQTTPTTETSIAFPPNGWYVHNFDTSIMLTKQKTLPSCQGTEGACYGEQINIHSSSITLTPEQYITKIIQDGVFPSAQRWDTLNGYKTFSMTYTTEANDVPTDGQYLFVGNTAYQFALYPSAEKDRADFQQVVKYYATK